MRDLANIGFKMERCKPVMKLDRHPLICITSVWLLSRGITHVILHGNDCKGLGMNGTEKRTV